MMAIRVLHLIGSLGLGGAQVCLKYLVENMIDPEINSYIYPLRKKKDCIPITGDIIGITYPNYDPRKFLAILKICRERKIDIIHAHLHKPVLGALLATFFSDVKVVVHEHGSIAHKGLQYSLYRILLRLLRKRASVFIAASNAVAKQLTHFSKIDPARIKVVYNAVDLDKFTPAPDIRDTIRKELGFSPEDIAIGFVGRLSHVKGPDILLNAFGKLAEKNKNYRLLYLGAGPMEQQLRKMAQSLAVADRVEFLGYRENVAEIMNAFDVGAITSRQDAFPLTPLELLSMKIPLVSCNVYGLAEVVEDMQNALVPADNKPGKIAECIERVVSDDQLRQSLTENGSETAKNFSIDRCVNAVEDIYRDICK
ncbi:MAG: glycosyltransferase [Phycisphaerae bacterium]|nr:glycosyltransferase [Phycisphaerae bacterium]